MASIFWYKYTEINSDPDCKVTKNMINIYELLADLVQKICIHYFIYEIMNKALELAQRLRRGKDLI